MREILTLEKRSGNGDNDFLNYSLEGQEISEELESIVAETREKIAQAYEGQSKVHGRLKVS